LLRKFRQRDLEPLARHIVETARRASERAVSVLLKGKEQDRPPVEGGKRHQLGTLADTYLARAFVGTCPCMPVSDLNHRTFCYWGQIHDYSGTLVLFMRDAQR
jgi:hypothetical protein